MNQKTEIKIQAVERYWNRKWYFTFHRRRKTGPGNTW